MSKFIYILNMEKVGLGFNQDSKPSNNEIND